LGGTFSTLNDEKMNGIISEPSKMLQRYEKYLIYANFNEIFGELNRICMVLTHPKG
jgi:hypothetical protein